MRLKAIKCFKFAESIKSKVLTLRPMGKMARSGQALLKLRRGLSCEGLVFGFMMSWSLICGPRSTSRHCPIQTWTCESDK